MKTHHHTFKENTAFKIWNWMLQGIFVAGVLSLLLFVALLFAGCSLGKPDGRIVSVTQSTIGISIGQSSADSVPHIHLGYERSTFHIVPTGTNINVPAVSNSMGLDNSISHQEINEEFSTGAATGYSTEGSPAKLKAAKPKVLPPIPVAKPSTNALVIFDQSSAGPSVEHMPVYDPLKTPVAPPNK